MNILFDNEGIYFPEEDVNDILYDPNKCSNVFIDLVLGKFDFNKSNNKKPYKNIYNYDNESNNKNNYKYDNDDYDDYDDYDDEYDIYDDYEYK